MRAVVFMLTNKAYLTVGLKYTVLYTAIRGSDEFVSSGAGSSHILRTGFSGGQSLGLNSGQAGKCSEFWLRCLNINRDNPAE